MRPRRWLQRRMVAYLDRFDRTERLVGLHMRTGFADWQYYSSSYHGATNNDGTYRAGHAWHEAATAAPMPFARHWQARPAPTALAPPLHRPEHLAPLLHRAAHFAARPHQTALRAQRRAALRRRCRAPERAVRLCCIPAPRRRLK